MLFTTALPQLPAAPRRAPAVDVTHRHAPADWPFAPPLSAALAGTAVDTLNRAHARHLVRRFTGSSLTGFGALA